ncbi:methylosome subunit pICln-like [Patiria miniata]|uniref:Methylosome subunit pICln n=1 Tax=Patiria miniata TaxID=46514 RepID=A0A914B4R5_PATMI|nr:methylosome subunit pICln-like [Patiria miniata]
MSFKMSLLSATQAPADGVRHKQNNVALHVERENLGNGVLYIAESYVSWINATSQGVKIPYPAISLHAVSRDLTAYPHECLYLMIDTALMPELLQIPISRDTGGAGDNEDDEEEETQPDQAGAIRELRFIPDNKQTLEPMFTVMSDCQTLHPDPEDSEPSDEDFGDEFDDAEEDMGEECAEGVEGSSVDEVTGQAGQGQQARAGLNGHAGSGTIKMAAQSGSGEHDEAMDTGQFADADMEPDH